MEKIKVVPQTTMDQAGKIVRTYGVIMEGIPRFYIKEDDDKPR